MRTSILDNPVFPAFVNHWECTIPRHGKSPVTIGGDKLYPALPYDCLPFEQTKRRLIHAIMRNGIYRLRRNYFSSGNPAGQNTDMFKDIVTFKIKYTQQGTRLGLGNAALGGRHQLFKDRTGRV